eukprot:4417017-Amphidinium_carterae.1
MALSSAFARTQECMRPALASGNFVMLCHCAHCIVVPKPATAPQQTPSTECSDRHILARVEQFWSELPLLMVEALGSVADGREHGVDDT